LLAVLVAAIGDAEAARLSDAEANGYLQWLHSLEQTVAARVAADAPESSLLFPFDWSDLPPEDEQPYRYLAIGRALAEIEREPSRERTAGSGTGTALNLARTYMSVSEFDSALAWLDRAAHRDSSGEFSDEIGHESLASAVASGDSTRLARRLAAVTARLENPTREAELVVALRVLAARGLDAQLDALLGALATDAGNFGARLRYWYAFALSGRQRWSDSLEQLRLLVRSGGLSCQLAEVQRAWVLVAIPDLLFLTGSPAAARDLYGVLAGCELVSLRLRGEYQLAQLDLIDARYARAAERLARLCEARENGPWSDHACELARLARELNRIQTEGEPYGAAAFYRP
jgi:hypothetical protein